MRSVTSLVGVGVFAIIMVTPVSLSWGDPAEGMFLAGGRVEATASANSASVQASSGENHDGAYVEPNDDYVAFDTTSGPEVVAVPDQLCRLVNPGEIDPMSPGRYTKVCITPTQPDAPVEDDVEAVVDPRAVAAGAAASLTVPAPELGFDPDPANNQWQSWVIGLPLWVDFDDPVSQTTSVANQGVEVALTAERGQIHLDWGDGTSSVCTRWGGWNPNMDIRTATPLCGHTYVEPGDYTVTATAAWTVSWSALGQSGSLPLTSTSQKMVPVVELQAVITG